MPRVAAATVVLVCAAATFGAFQSPHAAAGARAAVDNASGAVYADHFSDPGTGWPELDDADATRGYVNGEYRIAVKSPDSVVWVRNGPSLGQVDAQVDARAGGDGSGTQYGLLVRAAALRTYYAFFVDPEAGEVGVYHHGDDGWTPLVEMTASPMVHGGAASNRLRLVVSHDSLEAWLNGQRVATATDASILVGRVGLVAENDGAAGSAEVFFDNFSVYAAGQRPGRVALPALARHYDAATGAPPQSVTPPTRTGIFGLVTVGGLPAADITVTLRQYGGGQTDELATLHTGSDGRYDFAGVPSLPAGKAYYVYARPEGDDNLVASWYGPDLTKYAAGTTVHAGDFDLVGINLLSPEHGAEVRVPATLRWFMRPVVDAYQVLVFDPNGDDSWQSPVFGTTDHVDIGLPPGFSYGTPYGWLVRAYDTADSFGGSYYYREVTLRAAAALELPGLSLGTGPGPGAWSPATGKSLDEVRDARRTRSR